MTNIFVYGTLKRREERGRVLSEASQAGQARFVGHASMAGVGLISLGAYPGMLFSESGPTRTLGEVWSVSDDILEDLDAIEGHPNLFIRHGAEALVDHSTEFEYYEVEAYFYDLEPESFEPGTYYWQDGAVLTAPKSFTKQKDTEK